MIQETVTPEDVRDPEHGLFAAVILLAVEDAKLGDCDAGYRAALWLRGEACREDVEFICEMAGMNGKAIIEHARMKFPLSMYAGTIEMWKRQPERQQGPQWRAA